MIRALYTDRKLVVDILARAFDDNKSVNYMVRQDEKRALRIKRLMEYSFDVCYHSGEIYLSDNRTGCALVLLPDQRKTNLKSVLLDLKHVNVSYDTLGYSAIDGVLGNDVLVKYKAVINYKKLTLSLRMK